MKKTIITIIMMIISFEIKAYANICGKENKPTIITKLNYGTAKYERVAKEEIINITGLKNPLNTMGLTIANFEISYNIQMERNENKEGYCISIKRIEFEIGYKDLKVLIDEKYIPGSCEYEEIKKHEKEHIKIYQNELKYYGKLIIDEIKKIFENIPILYISTNMKEKEIRKEIENIINNNENINLLKKRLEEKLKKKNKEHDSKEEYKKIKESCNEW